MLLYRLQDKRTKKFFAGIRCYDGRLTWTDHGAFYRQIDTIIRHLEYIIGECVAREKDNFPKWTSYKHKKKSQPPSRYCHTTRNSSFCCDDKVRYFNRIYRGRLKHYRVVINDVIVKGERFIPAAKIMEKSK